MSDQANKWCWSAPNYPADPKAVAYALQHDVVDDLLTENWIRTYSIDTAQARGVDVPAK